MNMMKLEFLSNSENERFARSVIAAFVLELDPTVQEMSEIKTAVSEAVTNAIIHGYGEDIGKIVMEAMIREDMVEIKISDRGKGIEDIELAMEPMYTEAPEAERSGLGFTIMQSFMDEIEVESVSGRGTRVIMRKRVKR